MLVLSAERYQGPMAACRAEWIVLSSDQPPKTPCFLLFSVFRWLTEFCSFSHRIVKLAMSGAPHPGYMACAVKA